MSKNKLLDKKKEIFNKSETHFFCFLKKKIELYVCIVNVIIDLSFLKDMCKKEQFLNNLINCFFHFFFKAQRVVESKYNGLQKT